MVIFKITKRISFTLHIQLQKASISLKQQTLEDCDVASINNLEVLSLNIADRNVMKMPIQYTDTTNEISVRFPECLKEGAYDIIVCGEYNGDQISCIEHSVFSIVDGKYKMPIGIIDGEQGRPYNMKYWIELNDDSSTLSYYGALSTQYASNVSLSELQSCKGLLKGRTITINTTDSSDIAWIVSPTPLVFEQAHIKLSMQKTTINGLYYYSSDELKSGENVLKIT